MGGTGAFYTFRRAVFHESQRATTTAWPLACGCRAAHEPLGLVDERALRGAREALEGAQGERRLAALDLDRPRPRHQPVDEVAGADLQVAPLVDGVAVAVGQDAPAALGGVGEQDAVEGRQQRGGAGVSGSGRGAPGQVVERAPVLVLEALEVGAEALERLAHRRRAPADPARHVVGARRPEGPQVARTTSSSALSPFGAPRGRGAASRALGALAPHAPSAGARTKADQRWNGRHLSSRWRSSSAFERAWDARRATPRRRRRSSSWCAASAPRRPAASSAALRPRSPARRPCGASGGRRLAPRPRRRPGARAPRRGAASRAAACRRRARRPSSAA
jgi:hypothetical protein